MTISVQGVVSRGKGEPVEVTEVLVPDPGPGEALVRVQACGVCHTDLHYKMGGIGDDYPYLLGHEAAGVVEAVGDNVTEVAPGDFVILNWRAVCGQCRACKRGRPWYCFNTHNATQKMTLADGTELSPALGIGAFAEKILVAAGQCTKVNPAIAPATAGLLGCGVMAGLGAVINTGGVTRGDTVAVIGCGGVGDAAVLGARLAGARTIIAVDIDDRKLAWARELGATDTINSRNLLTPVEGIRELTGGFGTPTRVVVEAIGPPGDLQPGVLRPRPGRDVVVLVGVPDAGHEARAAAARGVRPGRRAQVLLVRRLPSVARLPDARRPAPGRPAAAGEVRLGDDRHRRRGGGVRQDGARRRAAQRGGLLSAGLSGAGPDAARIAMWSGPRTVSTAMMRAWENRPDTVVTDEPLYAFYLSSTGIDHPGRDEVIASQPASWQQVLSELADDPLPPGVTIAYAKHMTHHVLEPVDLAAFAPFRHAF